VLQQKKLNFFFSSFIKFPKCELQIFFSFLFLHHIATFFYYLVCMFFSVLFTNGNKVKFLLRIHAFFTSKFRIVTQINKSIIFTSHAKFFISFFLCVDVEFFTNEILKMKTNTFRMKLKQKAHFYLNKKRHMRG
jgi:hypothetical protein